MPRKRIVILVNGLPPVYNGGTEIATMRTAEHAARAGHDVHVLAADGSGGTVDPYRGTARGFEVHRVRVASMRYLYGLSYIPGAFRKITELKPDLVHVQGIYPALPAVFSRILTETPYLFYERGSVYVPYTINPLLYRLVARFAGRMVAQTEHERAKLQKFARGRVEVIPNGVDAGRFGQVSKEEARSQLGLPLGKKVVLSVGRCRPEKNLKDFVRAAVSDKDNTYILVGDGPELERLKALGWRSLVFAGHVDNSRIPLYVAAADVFVNTSRSEGFPVAILEAMAGGLPIVAPKVCGIPEIVEDGVNGILTEPRNYVSTRAAIRRLLRNGEMAVAMADANRGKARRYTWEAVVEKLYG